MAGRVTETCAYDVTHCITRKYGKEITETWKAASMRINNLEKN